MTLLVRAGGTMTAMNIPNRATLKALARLAGIILPAMQPKVVPIAHNGADANVAPYEYSGLRYPGRAIASANSSSVME